ncbi:MAG TPA: serine/threonine-protein kinase [Actinoallomurus sp.]|jgi:serine/threonine protein kinase|nr:serine/threonine-protein kinase [Actinoallomurus sp.]
MSLGEGSVLGGRYRLVTQIGRGGMGTVWHAYDELLDRDVAVKAMLIASELTTDEYDVLYTRTLREARLAARLSHPGIVTIHDIITEDGRPWIVMELISARSLEEVVQEDGPLEPRRVAEIGLQMVDALAVAHEAGILHRDIKPSNVLVSEARSARAVLTDFGVARAQSDATITQAGGLLGSPAYIAPERARGRPAGPSSDLWSLGATLYSAVEGRSPFERPETVASLVAILNDALAPMERAGPLRPVIEGLLRKDPEERLTAEEAADTLGRIIADGAGSPGPLRSGEPDGATVRPANSETDELLVRPELATPEPVAADPVTAEPVTVEPVVARGVTPEPAGPAAVKVPGGTRQFKAWQPLLVLAVLAIVADVVIFATR